MQISLYIGRKKKKDRIVDDELEKYVEGDRSNRIKDLILKGLIFEGRGDIDKTLLDMRYMYAKDNLTAATEIVQEGLVQKPTKVPYKRNDVSLDKPDFKGIKIKRTKVMDEELENRI